MDAWTLRVGPGDLVLVYVSSPRMALVGGFEVAGIIADLPEALCKKWQTQSGVEQETFLHYFQDAATAYGILISRTWQFLIFFTAHLVLFSDH